MNILIGVSGGIAAYKAPDLVRLFVKEGHNVKTILTENAKKFVSPLAIETVSKNKSYSDMFSSVKDVEHISLTKWADLMIVAPATANIISKLSNGNCDDLLSTVLIALDKPCYIFPSMNENMYTHPSVQENLSKLRDWGYLVYLPDQGELACGDKGKGRLPDIKLIYDTVLSEMAKASINSPLLDRVVTITAGSTKSYIDPVRYIANSASGRMGVEIARQAWLRGAKVNLICNGEVVERFPWVKSYSDLVILSDTTEDVLKSAEGIFDETDIYVSTAALCDFANKPAKNKIKKTKDLVKITLEPSVDVISQLSSKKKKQIMVGFALETDELELNACNKLKDKGLDMVIANSFEAIGSSSNKVVIIDSDGVRKYINEDEKRVISSQILEEIEKIFLDRDERANKVLGADFELNKDKTH